jgi:hypothetical protein
MSGECLWTIYQYQELTPLLTPLLAQRVDEALAIHIIHGDPFAPVTTIHDVRQHSRLSICRQYRESGFGRSSYQYQELTPLLTPLSD